MERKLIAIDLDGTTLNNHSLITSETKQAIQNLGRRPKETPHQRRHVDGQQAHDKSAQHPNS